jgi:hypothetical protein
MKQPYKHWSGPPRNPSLRHSTALYEQVFLLLAALSCFAQQCGLAGPNILSNGVADLTLTVETNRPYHLDASADLVNWSNLASFSSTNYLNHFLDYSATNLPQRFYRLATPSS